MRARTCSRRGLRSSRTRRASSATISARRATTTGPPSVRRRIGAASPTTSRSRRTAKSRASGRQRAAPPRGCCARWAHSRPRRGQRRKRPQRRARKPRLQPRDRAVQFHRGNAMDIEGVQPARRQPGKPAADTTDERHDRLSAGPSRQRQPHLRPPGVAYAVERRAGRARLHGRADAARVPVAGGDPHERAGRQPRHDGRLRHPVGRAKPRQRRLRADERPRHRDTATLSLSRSLPAGEGAGYRFLARGRNALQGAVAYQNNVGTYTVEAARLDGHEGIRPGTTRAASASSAATPSLRAR